MPQFDEIFAGAREALFQHHAEPIVWTKSNGTAVSAQAIVGSATLKQVDSETGLQFRRIRTLELLASDVPSPGRGDVATIDGEAWAFLELDWQQAGVSGVTLVRSEQAELTSRNFRNSP